jgi:hypothetical protein
LRACKADVQAAKIEELPLDMHLLKFGQLAPVRLFLRTMFVFLGD